MIRVRVLRASAGFTLAEIIVVVAIVGMAALVAIPYFATLSRRQRLVAAAHEIQQSLLAARMRAVRANQNTSLLITVAAPGDSQHEFDTITPDNPPAPPPPPVNKSYLPANAFLFVTTPTNSKVTFSSEGRMISETVPTPAIISVQGPVGGTIVNQVTIRTTSAGKVEVVTPAVWQ
jgi:prepilin-type N-terminal cleavage/methylation domain-containing protein